MAGKGDTDHEGRGGPGTAGAVLLVYGPRGVTSHPLPAAGRVVLGRDAGADVQVDDPLISSEHLVLHVGERLTVEDLGSTNGTAVCGRTIEAGFPIVVKAGDPIRVGSHLLMIRGGRSGDRVRHLHAPGHLEARLAEALAGGGPDGAPVALVRIAIGRGPIERVLEAVVDDLRPDDTVAMFGADQIVVLLAGMPVEMAEAVADRLRRRLTQEEVQARLAVAASPRDGRVAAALLEASARALGDAASTATEIILAPAMRDIYRTVERVADSELGVLILGETGAGKDLLARHVHRASARRAAPFVRLNCAALSEPLLESELFGHERGAFTGAAAAKPGLLETAAGGTMFLDEVGELSPAIQAKLLQAIETHEVLRVGSVTPRPVDIRFVAATNRDLAAGIAGGGFRADLYYRLAGVTVRIPPLRERAVEIVPLARHFLARMPRPYGRGTSLSAAAEQALAAHGWPGNIRELRHVIERAALLADGPIGPEHLDLAAAPAATPAARGAGAPPPSSGEGASERDRIIEALAACAGNQSHAAKQLGISRSTLIARIAHYGIPRPRKH